MEHARLGYSNERAPHALIGKPLGQHSGRKPLDRILFHRKEQAERVPLDEDLTRQPESVVEDECDTAEDRDR